MATAKPKLHGRAFYESIGSPKYIIAPMVDQSEFAWRLLTRSFLPPQDRASILAYSPMFHAKLFHDGAKYRRDHFEPLVTPLALAAPGDPEHVHHTITDADLYLDGNKNLDDRPLIVQFCANDPDVFLESAKIVQPFCDAVDLNLGCPQGIAKRGGYGAFLQESPETIYRLINRLHNELDIPVTAKFRIRETKEKTLEYAKMILDAGASIITVHGRLREQKGHNTGIANWEMIRYLRDNLPPETVIFANGNILQHEDIEQCLEATKADGVMSAEGNLYDPTIFAQPPAVGEEGREYFRGRDGKGGYRMDAVLRRYLDIIHKHVLGHEPPERAPLFLPSDLSSEERERHVDVQKHCRPGNEDDDGEPAAKRTKLAPSAEPDESKKSKHRLKRDAQKQDSNGKPREKTSNPNLVAMQAHCFHMLRALVSRHHNVRDALARSRAGDIDAYEHVLTLTEAAVREGLLAYERDPAAFEDQSRQDGDDAKPVDPSVSSDDAVRRCRRPYFVCQPYVRPLPAEAYAKGSMSLSKKELHRQAQLATQRVEAAPGGKVEKVDETTREDLRTADPAAVRDPGNQEVAAEGLVCG